MRETLVEAGGGQQVEAPPPSAAGAAGATLVYRFSVISTDRRLVVRIPLGPDGAAPRVALQRPGETRPAALAAPSGAGASGSSLRLSPHGDALQLDAATAHQEPWAGEWRLHVGYRGAAGGEAEPPRIAVWAWSGLRVDVRQREVGAPEPEAGEGDQSRVLLTFGGSGSASLSRCELQPRRIAAGADSPQTETERGLDLRPHSPHATGEGAGSGPHAPALITLVRLTHPAAGAAVLDLPMRVTGTDSLGHPFTRRLRGDVLLLEPRSAWRRRLASGRKIVLTAARIAEAIYEDGRVPSGLILEQGTRRRPVRIPEGGLRARLAGLLRREEASGAGLRFAVMGHELTAVVSLLGAARSGAAEVAEATEPVESRVEDSP